MIQNYGALRIQSLADYQFRRVEMAYTPPDQHIAHIWPINRDALKSISYL